MPLAPAITTSCTPPGRKFERNPLETFVVSLAADVDAESHSVHRLVSCTVDLASICVIAAVLLVISGSSALGRLRCEPPERANVGRRRCCVVGQRLRCGPNQVVYQPRSCHGGKNVSRKQAQRSVLRSSCRSRTAGITRRGCAKRACTALWTNNSLDCCTIAARSCRLQAIFPSACAADKGVKICMDAPVGNMFPNSEIRAHSHQKLERVRRSDDAHGTRGAAMRSTSHCPHRQGEWAEEERMLRKRKHTSRFETNSGSFPRSPWRQRTRTSPQVHNRPSCDHELDFAATRTRVCELIAKLHWRNIPNKPAKSTWKKEEDHVWIGTWPHGVYLACSAYSSRAPKKYRG